MKKRKAIELDDIEIYKSKETEVVKFTTDTKAESFVIEQSKKGVYFKGFLGDYMKFCYFMEKTKMEEKYKEALNECKNRKKA